MKNKIFPYTKYVIFISLGCFILLPLLHLFLRINLEDMQKVIESPQFFTMVTNSFLTTTIATLISVSLAFYLAWCMNRSHIKHKLWLSMLFTLPMLIPSISHGQGLVLLLGDNGILTNLFGINIHLYGYVGIILGGILYSFPAAFLLLNNSFQFEDYTLYEASQVLGISKFRQFIQITLTNMKRPLLSAIFMVFTMIFTDYGVPLIVGGKVLTLPTFMYREVIGLLDFSKGAIIGFILLLPAAIAFMIDLKNQNQGSSSTIIKSFEITNNRKRDKIAACICWSVVILIALPLIAFVILSFTKQYPHDISFSWQTIQKTLRYGLFGYILNGITIAIFTAFIGTWMTYICAYFTTRCKRCFSTTILHLISMISLAIPGLVLGLSYVICFQSSWMYGTLIILIVVNVVHFYASPYLMAYNALSNFNEKLEDVASIMGISSFQMIKDVYVPCTQSIIYEMFTYFVVNSMVTISAISFLSNFHTMPIALMIPQLDGQSFVEAMAFVSLLIFIINLLVKVIMIQVKKYSKRKDYHYVNKKSI